MLSSGRGTRSRAALEEVESNHLNARHKRINPRDEARGREPDISGGIENVDPLSSSRGTDGGIGGGGRVGEAPVDEPESSRRPGRIHASRQHIFDVNSVRVHTAETRTSRHNCGNMAGECPSCADLHWGR